MKYSFTIFILIILSILVFNSCRKATEFSIIPQIGFESIARYRVKEVQEIAGKLNISYDDSIPISISFKDGDGDLGLGPGDTVPPFNEYIPVTDSAGNIEIYGSRPGMPSYNTNDECNPYNPNYYYNGINDTVLANINPHYFNYHIVFLKKVGTTYDTISNCPNLNQCGRFPILSPPNYTGSLQGNLTITIFGDFTDPNSPITQPNPECKIQNLHRRQSFAPKQYH